MLGKGVGISKCSRTEEEVISSTSLSGSATSSVLAYGVRVSAQVGAARGNETSLFSQSSSTELLWCRLEEYHNIVSQNPH